MGVPKITGLLISLLLVSLCAGIFGTFMGGMNDAYPRADYNDSTLSKYEDRLDSIEGEAQKIKNATEFEQDPNILDIIGGYFSSAYQSLRITLNSFGLFKDMASDVVSDIPLPNIRNLLSTVMITIVVILIFIGIFIGILVKREKI